MKFLVQCQRKEKENRIVVRRDKLIGQLDTMVCSHYHLAQSRGKIELKNKEMTGHLQVLSSSGQRDLHGDV